MTAPAYVGAQVFDGTTLFDDHAVLIDGTCPGIIPRAEVPAECAVRMLDGGTLMPGFVDLQVNGGGGVMLGDDPSVETLRTMAAAHHKLGTRAFLPTLITDTHAKTLRAIAAVASAIDANVPGIIGLHLEGPHLDPRRKGAHDASLIRPMQETDLHLLLGAAQRLPNLMVTLAPESATLAQIKMLSAAGVIVSLGHSDADYESAMAAFDVGARCTTHLFNAMSPLSSRAPGLVGATIDSTATMAGLIADGIHVHPATIRAALAAKRGPGEIFLVTDAMATTGSEITGFTLGHRDIQRANGQLTLADGTLAGADLSMARALQVMIKEVGDDPAKAFARATSIPARLLREPFGAGGWPDSAEGLVYLSPDFEVQTLET